MTGVFPMQPANRHAFKEWASICRAVAAGRQSVLLRKGGIHERLGRFAVEHDEFWLFATRFHQSEELSPEGRRFLAGTRSGEPAEGFVSLPAYAVITDVLRIDREEVLPVLRPYHVYDDQVLADRFHYKSPGLALLVVRAFTPPDPPTLPDSPHFGGCRSWVELPSDLAAGHLRPALSDAAFDKLRREILAAAEGTAVA